jgi:glutathione S-transferase
MFGVALVDAAKTPLFAAWAERFREAEVAAKEVVPDADKVVEYFRKKASG